MWVALMLGCAVFAAFHHIANKRILKDASALHLMLGTSLGSAALALCLSGLLGPFAPRHLALALLAAFFALAGSYPLNIVYQRNEVSAVSPLLNLSPVILVVTAYVFLGERLSIVQAAGISLLILGGYLVTTSNSLLRPFRALPPRDYSLILATLVCWSIAPLFTKVLVLELDVLTYISLFAYSIAAWMTLAVLLTGKLRSAAEALARQWPLMLLAALLWLSSDLLAAVAFSIPQTQVNLMMPIKRVSTLIVVFLGGSMFMEKAIARKAFATALMLAGLFFIAVFG